MSLVGLTGSPEPEGKIMDKKLESLTVEGKDLKAGDVLTKGELEKVLVKQAWTHFTYVSGETGKYRNDEAVFIRRETEESRQARADEAYQVRRNTQIRAWFNTYVERANTKAAFAKMGEILDRDGGLASDWEVAGFIEAQAKDKVAARLHRAIRVFDEKLADGEEHPARDLVGVTEMVAERFTSELLTGVSGLSRSTSVVHNAMEDADRKAMAQFVDQRAYGGWFR